MHDRAEAGANPSRSRAGWIAAGIAMFATGLLYLGVTSLKAQGRAEAVANRATSRLLFDFGGGSKEDFAQYRDTEMAILRSPPTLEAALTRHPELLKTALLQGRADPILWLANQLEIQVVPNTRLIEVALASTAREEAPAIIDAAVDSYLKYATDSLHQSLNRRQVELEEVMRESKMASARCQQAILKAEASADDDAIVEVKRQLEVRDLGETRLAIRRLLIEKSAAETNLARKKSHKEPDPLVVTPLEDRVAVLSAQIAMLSRDEEKGLAALQKLEPARVDFQRLKKDVERAEDRVSAIEEERRRFDRESRFAGLRVHVVARAR